MFIFSMYNKYRIKLRKSLKGIKAMTTPITKEQTTGPLLIRTTKVRNHKEPELPTYQVWANQRAIGYVVRRESYIWEIESQFAPAIVSDTRRKKDAVARIVEFYREKA